MYCTKCGTKLNENGVCLNCAKMNSTNNVVKKTSVGKVYLKILLFSFYLFVFCAILRIIMRFRGTEISKTFDSILNYIQIAIPILLIMFGIIPAIIIANIKNK